MTDGFVFQVTREVNVGLPVYDPIWKLENGAGGEDYFCTSHHGNIYYLTGIENEILSHQVRVKTLSGSVRWTSPIRSGFLGEVNYYPHPGWYLIESRATNGCGTTNWIDNEIEYVDCTIGGGGEGEMFTLFPNPVNTSSFMVSSNNEQEKCLRTDAERFSIALIDKNQNVLKRVLDAENNCSVDVSGLAPDVYYVLITTGDFEETKRIVLK